VGKIGVTRYLTILDSDQAFFFDLAPYLLVVLDKAGNIVRVNRAFEETVGYTRYQICGVGIGLSRFIVMDDLIRFIRSFDHPGDNPANMFRFSKHGGSNTICYLLKWQVRHGRSFLIFDKVT
jgi:PAS domain S-box-containing protein